MRLDGNRYEELNEEVLDLMDTYHVTDYPLSLPLLAEKMGVNLVSYSTISRVERQVLEKMSEDAFTISRGAFSVGSTYICFNDSAHSPRIRHSIAHEFAHVWLDHADCDEPFETEAHYFAAYLLAPIPLILEHCDLNPISISFTFDVSYEAAKIAAERARNRIACGKPQHDYEYAIVNRCEVKGVEFMKKRI